MSARRTYRLIISWKHRKWGPQQVKIAAEGTSIRRAIASGLLAFFSDSNPGPHARRDAHAELEVKAWRTKTTPAK